MDKVKFTRRVLLKALTACGPYFLQGQVSYIAMIDGKSFAAGTFLANADAFGIPKEEQEKLKAETKPIKYMIDFSCDEANKIDEFYIAYKDRFLYDVLKNAIEKATDEVTITKENDQMMRLERIPTEEEKAAPAPAPEPEPEKAPEVKAGGKATYLHVGIPVTTKKPNMIYLDNFKVWITNVDDYDFKIEYLKYEEGTPFPEILHRNPHVAYMVDDMQPYLDQAELVLFGPVDLTPEISFAYIMMDNTIFELQAPKK